VLPFKLDPIEVRWDLPTDRFADLLIPARCGISVTNPGFGIVRIDPPINFRRLTNRKAKRQRCKARRRARLKAAKVR
jgi:hypothetical protein